VCEHGRTHCSIDENVLIRVTVIVRVVENNYSSLFLEAADGAVHVKEFFRIELAGTCTYQCARRTVQMNEHEAAFAGNDRILPVQKKYLFVGNHRYFVFAGKSNPKGGVIISSIKET